MRFFPSLRRDSLTCCHHVIALFLKRDAIKGTHWYPGILSNSNISSIGLSQSKNSFLLKLSENSGISTWNPESHRLSSAWISRLLSWSAGGATQCLLWRSYRLSFANRFLARPSSDWLSWRGWLAAWTGWCWWCRCSTVIKAVSVAWRRVSCRPIAKLSRVLRSSSSCYIFGGLFPWRHIV